MVQNKSVIWKIGYHPLEQQKGERHNKKSEDSLRNLRDNIKHASIGLIEVLCNEKGKKADWERKAPDDK